MKNYITIYGELITGEIVTINKNTVIVRTAKGGYHMVHKDSLDENFKTKRKANRLKCEGFDLQGCQTIGGKYPEVRKWRKIQ